MFLDVDRLLDLVKVGFAVAVLDTPGLEHGHISSNEFAVVGLVTA